MSATELRDLARLAARGAGAHAAQAAHFGRATVAHLTAGRDPKALQTALNELPGGPIQTLPFAASLDPVDGLSQTYSTLRTEKVVQPGAPARIDVPDRLVAFLTPLAGKTYVPASEASRLSGAGAGIADND